MYSTTERPGVCAGHHEPVPREELRDASNFVRFAMAAYSTQAYTWQVGR